MDHQYPSREGVTPHVTTRSRVARATGVLFAAAAIGGVTCFWFAHRTPTPDLQPTEPLEDEFVSRNPGYVGPQACASCHAERVAEFSKTHHFRACRRPDDGPIAPGFAPGRGTLVSPTPDLRFEMTHADGAFLHTSIRSDANSVDRLEDRIAFVYGAGTLDEVYFAWRDDRLFELPVGWLHKQGCWGTASWNPDWTTTIGREGTTRCLECHNTWFDYYPGTENRYRTDSFILGVTCERCHGPGREHVAFHQAHSNEPLGRSIAQPAKMSRERRIEVCTQCHSNATRARGPELEYRPGQPLNDYYRTATSHHPEEDHVANQVQYLRESKCFQQSNMTCVTCHNPHHSESRAEVQRSCLKCHESAACREQPRIPAAVRSDCTGCHMPDRVWMNVHFHTADERYLPPIRRYDHRIAVYPEARDAVLLAWYRKQPDEKSHQKATELSRALTDYWMAEADTRRRDYRFLSAVGAIREALDVDPSHSIRDKLTEEMALQDQFGAGLKKARSRIDDQRFPEATDVLTGLIRLKPDSSLAHALLGTAAAGAGDESAAVRQWQEAARLDPNDSYGLIMTGWVALLDGRAEEAVEMYRRADEVTPYHAEITYRLGMSLEKLGHLAEAADAFRRATVIDPGHVGGHLRLSVVLRRQGHADEAISSARRAAKITRFENAEALMTLAEACMAAGRHDEGEDFAAKALAAARPDEVAAMRTRLEAMRAGPSASAR